MNSEKYKREDFDRPIKLVFLCKIKSFFENKTWIDEVVNCYKTH